MLHPRPDGAAASGAGTMARARAVAALLAMVTAFSALAGLTTVITVGPARGAVLPVENYASYQPQTTCSPSAKPGTVALGRWLVATYGGRFGSIGRTCTGRSISEHKEGRAFDWTLSARKPSDRARAARFLAAAFATGPSGQKAELARRMGIMYVIWNDRMYAAYRGFTPRAYLSSSCASLKRCSKTLRHRDHMHVSLLREAATGRTSWYAGRVPGVTVLPVAPTLAPWQPPTWQPPVTSTPVPLTPTPTAPTPGAGG